MSALPPKADMCSALVHVRFVPKADMRSLRRSVLPVLVVFPSHQTPAQSPERFASAKCIFNVGENQESGSI